MGRVEGVTGNVSMICGGSGSEFGGRSSERSQPEP